MHAGRPETEDVLGHYKLGGTRHCDGLTIKLFIQRNRATVVSDSASLS
jgi:hypothetical protein